MSRNEEESQQQHDEHLELLNKLNDCNNDVEFKKLLLQARAANLDLSTKFRIEKKNNEEKNKKSEEKDGDGNNSENAREEEPYYGTLLHGVVLNGYDWKIELFWKEVEERREIQIEKDNEEEHKKRKQTTTTTEDGGGKRSKKESSAAVVIEEETTKGKKRLNEESTTAATAAKIARKDDETTEEISMMSLLLTTDSNGQTPLHLAVVLNHQGCLDSLLGECETDQDRLALLTAIDNEGRNVLHLALSCDKDHLVSRILSDCFKSKEKTVDLILKADNEGKTVLHYCLLQNDLRLVRDLRRYSFNNGRLWEAFRKTVDEDGRTVLHLAVLKQDVELVKWLISVEKGLCFIQDKNGKTALFAAAEADADCVFSLLLNSERNKKKLLWLADNHGETVIDYASKNDRFQIIKSICSSRWAVKDGKIEELLSKTVGENGQTLLHRAAAAGTQCTTDAIRAMALECSDLLFVQDVDGKTALHIALQSKATLETFTALLDGCRGDERCKRLILTKDNDGRTVFQEVVDRDNFSLLQLLMKQKWSLQDSQAAEILRTTLNKNGQTCLHRAATSTPAAPKETYDRSYRQQSPMLFANTTSIKAMMSLDPDLAFIQDVNGKTALHIAVESRTMRDGFVVLLEGCRSDEDRMKLVLIKDNAGHSVLQVAIHNDHFWIVEHLTKQQWFVKNERAADVLRATMYKNGQTFLHRAATIIAALSKDKSNGAYWHQPTDNTATIKAMMSIDPDLAFVQDVNGKTALHITVQCGKMCDGLIALLNGCRSDEDRMKLVLMKDNAGHSVLQVAIHNDHFWIVQHLMKQQWFVKNEQAADVLRATMYKNGQTFLHRAARTTSAACWQRDRTTDNTIKAMMSIDPDLAFVQDLNGKTALHFAADDGFIALLNGCRTDEDRMKLVLMKDNAGHSVLQVAIHNDYFWIVQHLMKQQWFVKDKRVPVILRTTVNNKGETILHRAVLRRDDNLIKSLLNNDNTIFSVRDNEGYTALHRAVIKGRNSRENDCNYFPPSLLRDEDGNPRMNIDPNIAIGFSNIF